MKSVKIGNIKIENPICLSPMAGFSSLPFRIICNEMGAAYSPTELVSARSIRYNGIGKSLRYMRIAPDEEKITAIVQKVYGGDGITVLPAAKKQIAQLESLGFGRLPVCIAKTQYSFSDDPNKLGAPEHFTVTVKNVKVSAGAGFVVVLTGDIMTMPGLPKAPAAEKIDVDENGRITGLF